MRRTQKILFTLLTTLTLFTPTFAAEKNIVLFVTDDLSPDLGCYGNTAVQTPNLDRLATESTLYEHAFATTASCSASRSVILSGLHNHSNGHYGHLHNYHKFSAHPWVQSLPVLLRRQGYRTANIGKFHVGPKSVFDFDQEFPQAQRNPVKMAENCREFLQAQTDAKSPFFLYFATYDPHRSGKVAAHLPGKPNRFGNTQSTEAGVEQQVFDPSNVLVPPFLPDTLECRAELAQYYQSVARVDKAVGRLIEILKATGHWENTLFVFTSDHGIAFPGAKTSVYEAGLRVPFLVHNPYLPANQQKATNSDALISHIDITPTLLDFAGGLDPATRGLRQSDNQKATNKKPYLKHEWETRVHLPHAPDSAPETGRMRPLPYTFHGRSILPTLGRSSTPGWDAITASHTFHEIQMYYPMRVYRDRHYKIIWNIAHQLPYPFASDLWNSPTWQAQHRQGPTTPFGNRTVETMMRHPKYELFDIKSDPEEKRNLADDPAHADTLATYLQKLKRFQRDTGDPWSIKWHYE